MRAVAGRQLLGLRLPNISGRNQNVFEAFLQIISFRAHHQHLEAVAAISYQSRPHSDR